MVRKIVDMVAAATAGADAAVKKKPPTAASRLRKFNRDVKNAQKSSHEKHCFNRTQFKRLVVEVMKECAEGHRISSAALDPLMEIVEASLHKVFLSARYMCLNVAKKGSIDIVAFNHAEMCMLRPEMVGPALAQSSFADTEKGICTDKQAYTGEPPEKRPRKEKAADGAEDEGPAEDDAAGEDAE